MTSDRPASPVDEITHFRSTDEADLSASDNPDHKDLT